MRVTFWGTRGSIATGADTAGLRRKLRAALMAPAGRRFADEAEADRFIDGSLPFDVRGTYGGESSCVQVETGMADEDLICDLGSGARRYGNDCIATHGPGRPRTYHVLMSHLHWDHVMGFPMFVPAYIPGNRIVIHSCHREAEAAFRAQHSHPGFPVDFTDLGATIEFVTLEPGQTRAIAGFRVTPKLQRHPGGSYGYRIEREGRTVVYATDSEHDLDHEVERESVIDFFRAADLVVFDAMYTLADAMTARQDWGHSSNMVGVELCHAAGAHRIALFHHDPVQTDEALERTLGQTVRYEEMHRGSAPPLQVLGAYDGLVLTV